MPLIDLGSKHQVLCVGKSAHFKDKVLWRKLDEFMLPRKASKLCLLLPVPKPTQVGGLSILR